ncbi:MAG: glycosyltransferase family 2 protein [bacterium]|nr:glycosyltransferase family 2 protein [bacterium]
MPRSREVPVDLSIVVPVFNERDNLMPLLAEIKRAVTPIGLSAEIVFVDDGSTDGSTEKIAALCEAHADTRCLRFRGNRGQTAALDAGFKSARGEVVVTLDSDLQNDPGDIPRLLEALDEYDAVVGYRRERKDGTLRRVSSRVANRVRNVISGDDIIDTGCSLKAFRRQTLADLKLFTGMHRFLPTLLRIEGYRVTQVPVNHRPRRSGRSKYGVWNRAFRSFTDLLAVRWMKKRRLDYEVLRDL